MGGHTIPEARGRSERMFGTLQKRLPQRFRCGSDHPGKLRLWVRHPQISTSREHNARLDVVIDEEVDVVNDVRSPGGHHA